MALHGGNMHAYRGEHGLVGALETNTGVNRVLIASVCALGVWWYGHFRARPLKEPRLRAESGFMGRKGTADTKPGKARERSG